MADYRFAAQVISRSQGRSVTAAAAYRAASVIADARTGELHDYIRKGGVEWTGTMAPGNAPAWARDREKLWNMVEQKEIRKDAQLAREVQLSLPHELNLEQRRQLVCDFVQREFVGRGMVADIAMHKPDRGGDQRNFHVHILLTTREIGREGFGKKNRDWNGREELTAMRAAWAEVQNEHLRRHLGPKAPQVTHLSYADRGVDKVATVHLGPTATGMERRGMETFLGDRNRDTARRNQAVHTARRRAAEIESAVGERKVWSFGYVENEAKLEAKKAIDDKHQAETRLANILSKKRDMSGGTSRKALEGEVLRETRADIRTLKCRLESATQQGLDLRKRARSLKSWVTNPARMIWLKIAELHQRDRLEATLRLAEAKLQVRREWLASADGKAWVAKRRKSAEWRVLRSEERKARRHVRATERQISEALAVAKKAEGLKTVVYARADAPEGIALPETVQSRSRYLTEISQKLDSIVQTLPSQLRSKLAEQLTKGRSIAD